ncbi:MAG: DarT ssDNA thymidine ADP-ribosyltransferase family protein [Gaiellaceae bacterium]
MTAYTRAQGRGVAEIVHYTSERGVMGTVMKGMLLSRQRVQADPDLEFIFEGVWERRDPEWLDHISLSVSRINLDLFERSRTNHPQYWWAVMGFDPAILENEDDVWFTTTNNVYEDVCQRGQGEPGFEAMFGQEIPWGYYGSVHRRAAGYPDAWPTDRAAELLYPGEISLEFLLHLYVPGRQHRRLVDAWCEIYGRDPLPIVIDPAAFS